MCRAYSSIIWSMIQRRLGARPSGQVRTARRSRPPLARAYDGVLPQGSQLVGAVLGGGAPLPVRVGLPVDGVPRRRVVMAEQRAGEPPVLDQGQVLHHPAERHRGSGGPGAEAFRTEAAALPGERRAVIVEVGDEHRRLVGRRRRLWSAVCVQTERRAVAAFVGVHAPSLPHRPQGTEPTTQSRLLRDPMAALHSPTFLFVRRRSWTRIRSRITEDRRPKPVGATQTAGTWGLSQERRSGL